MRAPAAPVALSAPFYASAYYGPRYYPYYAPYAYGYPYSYPYYPYAYAPVYAPAYAPPQYVQQQAAPVQQAAQAHWYFCPASNGYYPYVRECPGGWQSVSPVPMR